MQSLITSFRLSVATLLICVGGYTSMILGFAQIVTPHTANGSLLMRADGSVLGSELLAQAFARPEYFWPRPSAVGYDAAGAGGSNESPTSADLIERARQIVGSYGATATSRLPADLVAASGGGLDPHISEAAALYQVGRVAAARGLSAAEVATLVERSAFAPGWAFTGSRIVNVLVLNRALDDTF